jgi:cytochrome oxidase assembly protein ShyY1
MSENPEPATATDARARPGVLGVLRQRRWIGLTLLIVILIPTFLLLGRWQWHRYEWRRDLNASITAGLAGHPIPLLNIAKPGQPWQKDNRYKHVVVSGTYDANAQTLIRSRPLNATNGFYVVTPLDLSRGPVRGGTVLVARGWVAAGDNSNATPQVSPPPTGTVVVDGWLDQPDKNPGPRQSDLPDGQSQAAYPGNFGGQSQMIDGVVVLISSVPAQPNDLTVLPLPELGAGPHISYMIQWFCFAILAFVGWWVLLRRDVREQAASVTADVGTPSQ